jgi:hypothetical protein
MRSFRISAAYGNQGDDERVVARGERHSEPQELSKVSMGQKRVLLRGEEGGSDALCDVDAEAVLTANPGHHQQRAFRWATGGRLLPNAIIWSVSFSSPMMCPPSSAPSATLKSGRWPAL